jgi:hypothetical protein
VTARPALGRSTDATPAPASPAAAVSLDRVELPDLPTFRGPSWGLLGALRWAIPLLVGGGLYSLAMHGRLSIAWVLACLALGGAGSGAAHAAIERRKRRLLAAAEQLSSYAERNVGPQHELSGRARRAVRRLRERWLPHEVSTGTDVEQALHYTRELLRRGG